MLARSAPARGARRAGRAVLTRFRERVDAAGPDDRRAVAGVRGRLLIAVIFRLAGALAFDRERARQVHTSVEWRVGQPDGGAVLHTMVIDEGRCRIRGRPLAEPDLVIELAAEDLLRLVAGLEDGVTLFGRGRLKLNGDLGVAMKLPRLFRPGRRSR